jgi:hypothetical protein
MANLKFDKAITARIVIDPCNDVTHTALSSSRLSWENTFPFFDAKHVSIPVAVSVFPASAIKPRGVGQSGRIPNVSMTTRLRQAGTVRRGNSRSSSLSSSARRSEHCAHGSRVDVAHNARAASPGACRGKQP